MNNKIDKQKEYRANKIMEQNGYKAVEPVGCSCDKCLCLWPVDQKFCGECGNELHKSEEKPLIVRSGETWVAHWKGVDYLFFGNGLKIYIGDCSQEMEPIFFIDNDIHPSWKPFSEIEKEGLTDEIAKLNPILYSEKRKSLFNLYKIRESVALIETIGTWNAWWEDLTQLRLATPHELQEQS